MKILHTSDWHLGHQLYGYDRTEEQQNMLDQMVEIVKRHQPDVFLLCGDVYHVPQPSSIVQKMFAEAVLKLRQANPDMRIIITAGNHDSGSRHEIFRTPWSVLGVDVVGTLRINNPQDHIIELPGKGFIIPIPYAHEKFIPDDFYDRLTQIVEERNNENLPVIMTAHTTVNGADFTGHEHNDDSIIGGIEGTKVDKFGTGFDYLALGHIHHEQFVQTGRHNVRYSGTPLAVSFDEDFPHSITMVDIEKHGEKPKMEKIEIANPRPLVTLPNGGYTDWDNAKKLLDNYPNDQEAYIRLNVEVDNFLPQGAFDECRQISETKKCRFCLINDKRHRDATSGVSESLTVSEFKKMKPIEIAKRYVEDSGGVFDEDMDEMFREVMSLLENND